MKRLITLATALAVSLSLTACGATLTKIEAPPNIILNKGETQLVELVNSFNKEDLDTEAIQKALDAAKLVWTSSDEKIVTVSDGTVKAIAVGEADITVTAKGVSDVIHVTVVIPPTGIEAPEKLELAINGEKSKPLNAKAVPEDATNVKYEYTSSDEKIATVDSSGTVTAVAVGECVVTTSLVTSAPQEPNVKADETKLTAKTNVTVSVAATELSLNKTKGTLNVGGAITLKPTIAPADAKNTALTWASSDENIATVKDGVVTTVSDGEVTITASTENGLKAEYVLTVRKKAAAQPNNPAGGTSTGSSAGNNTSGGSSPTGGQPAAPAPAPEPPAPAPEPPAPPACYHGNGSDGGTCPGCGLSYSRATRS